MGDTWLLTGTSGFVGRWLRREMDHRFASTGARVAELPHNLDLRSGDALDAHVASIQPDRVVHLAAQTFVPESFNDPQATYDVNFGGTLNLLRALKRAGFAGRMLYVGSSDVYGTVAEDALPIVETQPLRPRSPYAVSKTAAEALCFQWSATENFDVVIARPFNHIGPGQSDRFVLSSFARQIAAIALGQRAPAMDVGNLEATRDFTDVRDVVRAYLDLIEQGVRGESYNICSGAERSIRSLLDRLIAISGMAIEVRPDASRIRAAEQLRSFGSFEKLEALTGWRPRHTIDGTLRDMVDDWKQRLSGE